MDKTAYDRIASRDSFHFWHIGRREIIADQLSRILVKKHGNELLDIGCGPGGNISALKSFGRVTGIDVSEDALIYTYEAGYDTVVKSDISHMPFADNTFDIISSLDVFEHIADDVRVMKECYRL